jgi:SAM-dependent methyltransferase
MAEFDRYANDYKVMLDDSLAPLGGFNDYYLHRKVLLLEKSVKNNGGIQSVLDFGCGLGGTTLMLQKAFADARVVGVDISSNSIEQARLQSPGIEFGCIADDAFMASCWGTFDLVYVANVFHHVPLIERSIVMSTLKKMLAPNGRVFFFEHNPYNPITKWVVARCEFDRDAILLTPHEARSLFEESGFTVDRTMHFLFFPHMLRFLSKIESSLKWLPLGAQYCVAASL